MCPSISSDPPVVLLPAGAELMVRPPKTCSKIEDFSSVLVNGNGSAFWGIRLMINMCIRLGFVVTSTAVKLQE